ncbi:MAG: GNAT family N-acetyltransferase [Gammaproteobacteria bacterium]|nr:GNAT family N-acetyltransferase [Gammaproteobacteria bacterium]
MTIPAARPARSLMAGEPFIETQRLTLRELDTNDASFILKLLNEPSFLLFIGDKGVRTLVDAQAYLVGGPMASYEQHGFGLYLVSLHECGTPVGTCGLLKREAMDAPDIGFAFLPEYWSYGYAFESAKEIISRARSLLGLERLIAITAPDNHASIKLLTRLGFVFDKTLAHFGDAGESNLYALDL